MRGQIPERPVAGNVGVRALHGACPEAARPAARALHAKGSAPPQADWARGRRGPLQIRPPCLAQPRRRCNICHRYCSCLSILMGQILCEAGTLVKDC